MQKDKYALLDTDFISKMHIIQKDDENHLIDRIMELPRYQFCCHSQIRTELSRHNVSGSMEWLEEKISKGQIKCYSDEDIVDELKLIYGTPASLLLYANLLQKACQAYRAGYFEDNFKELQKIDYRNITKNEFFEALKVDCGNIGVSQNLGEIKTYVLLQMLSVMMGEQIYVFCSDDQNARSGIVSIGGVRCISVLSSFVRLKKECNFEWEVARDYIQSWLDFCIEHKQTTFKVQESAKTMRMCKVPCAQVMREIYEDKLEETITGYLRYK
ncbi:MAG: hypothetical protein PUC12_00025 [Clostridiales bacterium]|nr:hypothetical protein [Clostridiales bacterium]